MGAHEWKLMICVTVLFDFSFAMFHELVSSSFCCAVRFI